MPTSTDAVFGWGRPADIANDRISVMVAATARTAVRPILQALSDLGVASIAILTAPLDGPFDVVLALGLFVFHRLDRRLAEEV